MGYSVEAQCVGMPVEDFSSLSFKHGSASVLGWRWVKWQEMMDVLNARAQSLDRLDSTRSTQLEACANFTRDLTEVCERIAQRVSKDDGDMLEAKHLVRQIQENI